MWSALTAVACVRAQAVYLESAVWHPPRVAGEPGRAAVPVSRARCPRRGRSAVTSIAPHMVSDCARTARGGGGGGGVWSALTAVACVRAQGLGRESAVWHTPRVAGEPGRAAGAVSRARCPRRGRSAVPSIAPHIVSDCARTARDGGGGGSVWSSLTIVACVRAQGVVLESAEIQIQIQNILVTQVKPATSC